MHNAGQQGIGADLVRAEDEPAGAVDGAAGHAVAGFLFHRQRLAGDHGFIHGGGARLDNPVHRHARAGPDAQPVAGLHRGEGNLRLSGTVEADGGGRGEVEQRLDRARSAGAGAEFQHLADQHEHDDDGGRLEIEIHPAGALHAGGKQPGQKKRDKAVEPRSTDAERN